MNNSSHYYLPSNYYTSTNGSYNCELSNDYQLHQQPWSSTSLSSANYSANQSFGQNDTGYQSFYGFENLPSSPLPATNVHLSSSPLINQHQPSETMRKRLVSDIVELAFANENQQPSMSDPTTSLPSRIKKRKRCNIEKLNIVIDTESRSNQIKLRRETNEESLSIGNLTNQQFKCDQCSRQFVSACKLLMHKHKQHLNGSSSQCPICC